MLDSTPLLAGAHRSGNGYCAMELVAFLAGEPHSDKPACACPVLAAFVRSANDRANDTDRQALKLLLPVLIGSRSGQSIERKRAYLLADYAVRKWAPRSLRSVDMEAEAATLEALEPLIDGDTARAAIDAAVATVYAANAAVYAANAAVYAAEAAYAAAYAAAVPIEEQIAAVMEALKITKEQA